MHTFAALVLTLILGAQTTVPMDRQAISHAAVQRHGAGTKLSSILISGPFAVIRGTSASGAVHEGLRFERGGWRIVCDLGPQSPSADALMRQCGFSQQRALQLAADEAVNVAAASGRFAAAVAPAQRAYAFSLPATQKAEAARVQLLQQLNQQMRIGQISRADAIRKWNEMRFSWFLP